MSQLKRTALYDAHVALGATMVDFGGWEMPIQYPAGILTEHLNDRKGCGIFDVSHMGRLIVEGPQRKEFLQKVLTSNVEKLVPGRAQYCIIANEMAALWTMRTCTCTKKISTCSSSTLPIPIRIWLTLPDICRIMTVPSPILPIAMLPLPFRALTATAF